jgi:exonuclease SbcD
MRVLHFADLHIGVELYGRPLAGKPWSSRMQDFLDAFDHLVDYALEEGVDAVIFAGDAFKSREPGQTQQREFARRIRRLSNAGIVSFLLVGNHDLPNAEGRANVLEIYRMLEVPNVVVGDDSWFQEQGLVPRVLETRAGPLQVAFLPWPQVSRIVGSSAATAAMSIDQVYSLAEKEMTNLVVQQAAALDPRVPSVLAAHVSLNDFLVRENQGSERWMTVGTAPTMLKSSLQAHHFDYIALGHHHNNMEMGLETPCYYAGSMQPVDFGEEGQPKGFMVLDIDPAKRLGSRVGGSGLPRLVPIPARKFLTIEVKPKADDPTPEVCAAIEKADVRDAVVQLKVELTTEQSRLFRQPEARDLLGDAHFIAGIRVLLPDDPRTLLPAGFQPDSSSPIEALETYLKLQEYDDKRRERLLQAARDLMAETDPAGVASA